MGKPKCAKIAKVMTMFFFEIDGLCEIATSIKKPDIIRLFIQFVILSEAKNPLMVCSGMLRLYLSMTCLT